MSESVDDDGFEAMGRWLCAGLDNLDDGDVVEFGPALTPTDAEGPCDCAEVWRLGDLFLVRLSRVVLFELPDDVDALPLDTWVEDPEGTDGRLLTTDRALVAESVVSWFRDRLRVPSTSELAFTHSEGVDIDG